MLIAKIFITTSTIVASYGTAPSYDRCSYVQDMYALIKPSMSWSEVQAHFRLRDPKACPNPFVLDETNDPLMETP